MSPFHRFHLAPFHRFHLAPFHLSPFSPFHPFHLSSLCLLPGWPGLTRDTNCCILKFKIWLYSFSPCHLFTVFTFHLFTVFTFHLFTFSPLSPFIPLPFAGLARADPRYELLYTKIKNLAVHFRFHLVTFSPFSPFHLFTVFTFFILSPFTFSPLSPLGHPLAFCRAGPG